MRNLTRPPLLAVPSDISAALDALGIEHVIRGSEAVGLCPDPAHHDRKPSWSCNLRNGMHHCFSCGYGGSFTRLVATVRRLRYEEADLWVRLHRVQHQPGDEAPPAEDAPPEVREADLWAFTEPPAEQLTARGVSREAAEQLEILWNGKGWIFPIRDPRTGKLLGWQSKRGKQVRNRPAGMGRPASLFGLATARDAGTDGDVIIVESPLNAARFLTAGFPRVVATYGIEFTDQQIAVAQSLGTHLLFAHDNDRAGQQKVARWLHEHPLERQFSRVFDYGAMREDPVSHALVHPAGDGRDPGNLTSHQLAWGVAWATPACRTRFEEFPQWR